MYHVWRKRLTAITQECCEQYWTNPGDNTPQKAAVRPPTTYHKKHPELEMRDTAGEVRTNLWAMYSRRPLHMDKQRLDDQLEPMFNSSVSIQDVTWKICRERWTIEGQRYPCLQHDMIIVIIIWNHITLSKQVIIIKWKWLLETI